MVLLHFQFDCIYLFHFQRIQTNLGSFVNEQLLG